ncbi:MAG: iron-sulfur cluster loop [Ignisphaera sp.]
MPTLVNRRIASIAETLPRVVSEEHKMNVFDHRFYPKSNEPLEQVLMYFLVMVAMDHRLSRPGKPYEAVIVGERLRGADLLYRLGIEMFRNNPDFFSPEHLARVREDEVAKWLSIGDAKPVDIGLRTHLLNDLGQKMILVYGSNPKNIILLSKNYIRSLNGYGLADLLKVFKAYQDPVEKKIFLLVKFLVYRGLFNPMDKENLHVAVDNHLTRIALRTGVVELEDSLSEKVVRGSPISHDEDVLIRLAVREAYKMLSRLSGVDPLLIDDFMWYFGRSVCRYDEPKCGVCSFKSFCRAYEMGSFANEPLYYDTWYY